MPTRSGGRSLRSWGWRRSEVVEQTSQRVAVLRKGRDTGGDELVSPPCAPLAFQMPTTQRKSRLPEPGKGRRTEKAPQFTRIQSPRSFDSIAAQIRDA